VVCGDTDGGGKGAGGGDYMWRMLLHKCYGVLSIVSSIVFVAFWGGNCLDLLLGLSIWKGGCSHACLFNVVVERAHDFLEFFLCIFPLCGC
jgi:hypothetical protein